MHSGCADDVFAFLVGMLPGIPGIEFHAGHNNYLSPVRMLQKQHD